MSVWSTLQQEFEKLKEKAAKGVIPSYTLYKKMDELRNQEKLTTLKGMFDEAI